MSRRSIPGSLWKHAGSLCALCVSIACHQTIEEGAMLPIEGAMGEVAPQQGDGAALLVGIGRILRFEPGAGAGFGQDRMPDIVLGAPKGAGERQGSLDVLSLGIGGSIVVEMQREIVDGRGADFVVFENPFRYLGSNLPFAEPGFVALSEDGEHFVEFPCAAAQAPDYPGCAGIKPVYANAERAEPDPRMPEQGGGDAFDLSSLGLTRARFLRIRDAALSSDGGGGTAGFDLDAVVAIHWQ